MTNKIVQTTKNYEQFRPIEGNRAINLTNINKLRKAIGENYLYTILVVNENNQIIDGHHRFIVIKELKLDMHYVICEGYGLREVHLLNQVSKTWTVDDYMIGYCNLGYEDYIIYRDFKEKYKMGHNECLSMLVGQAIKTDYSIFYKGLFKVTHYEEACEKMEKIQQIQPYYKNYKRREFIFAILSLMKNPNFDIDEFINKLEIQPTSLRDCTTVMGYKSIIEDIYNYRRKDKVNLRLT